MPMRPRSTKTTLETALTIPVNIHVSADQDVIPQRHDVGVAQAEGVAQAPDSLPADWTGDLGATDQPGRDVRVDLVDQPRGQKRGVRLGTAFDKKAQDASLSQLVEQRLDRNPPVGPWRQ